MRQHKSIESILSKLDKGKYQVADDWGFEEARKLFLNPEVADSNSIEVTLLNIFFQKMSSP